MDLPMLSQAAFFAGLPGRVPMRAMPIVWMILCCALPAAGWERLITQQGVEIEGDVTQQEFVFIDASGGEVAIPRAAVVRFEASPEGLKAFVKDGVVITGTLQGKFEIEDGLVKRRYLGTDIKQVNFDQFIVIEKGKKYRSCPIRMDIDLTTVLLGEVLGTKVTRSREIDCKELRVASISFDRNGKIKPHRTTNLETELTLSIPAGEDQLVDLSLQLTQNERVIAKSHKRLTANEGENSTITLVVSFSGEKLDLAGPAPHLLLQVVSQDAEREVERGGVFWWFTIPFG